jgi:hypothetical protein
VFGVVVNGLACRLHRGVDAKRVAGVRVSVVVREVAAGNLEANLMARQEDIAGGPNIDHVLVDLTRSDGRGVLQRVAIPRADDPVVEIDRVSFGEDVDELGRPVRSTTHRA